MPAPKPTWIGQLHPASFRNIPFVVRSHEMEGGRKVVRFEYPQQDQAYVEDLGRKGRVFRVEAFVVGDDYIAQRDALVGALEAPGPATLVHPYLGTKFVAVGPFRVNESGHEGGMATFGIDFLETVNGPFAPLASRSTVSPDGTLVGGSTDDVLQSAQNALTTNQYQVTIPGSAGTSMPNWSLSSAAQVLTDWTMKLQNELSPVITGTQALASMKSQLDHIIHTASTLVRTPLDIATQLGLVLQSLLSWPDTPRLGLNALIAAYNFTPTFGPPSPTTTIRATEHGNYVALVTYLQTISLVQAVHFAVAATAATPGRTISTAPRSVNVAPPIGYDSYQDAIAVRKVLTDAIDALSDSADDDTFAALTQLRADLALAVPGTPNTLPELEPFTPITTVPALVLAQRLYGDITLADDLVARNGIQHPGFVPGGQPLQVLSHV